MKTYISKLKRSRKIITTYQVVQPSEKTCCLCKCKLNHESVTELRPTGSSGKVQRWTYCAPCYLDYNQFCNRNIDSRILMEFQQHVLGDCHSMIRFHEFRIG